MEAGSLLAGGRGQLTKRFVFVRHVWGCMCGGANASLDNEQAKLENVNSAFYPARCLQQQQQQQQEQHCR